MNVEGSPSHKERVHCLIHPRTIAHVVALQGTVSISDVRIYRMDHNSNCNSAVTKISHFQNVELDQLRNKTTRDSSRIELTQPNWNLVKDTGNNTKPSERDENPRKEYQKYSVNSTAARSPATNRNADNKSINNIITKSVSESSQDLDSELKKVANIDEVANSIRQQYERNAKTLETLNNQEKGITIDRSKRFLGIESDYVDVEQVPLSNKFYRHPNLSYEEQKRLEVNKEVLGAMNSSRPLLGTELSSKESKRHSYVPVYPECNDADNLEVDDLNASPPKHLKTLNESEDVNEDKNLLQENSKTAGQVPSTKESQKLPLDQNPSSVPKSLKGPTDKTYINIQDHQRDIEETTSSDTPVYDPKKIPYVDVPDYSDIREESLDEEDRRADKGGLKGGDVDSVDPEMSTNRYEPSSSTEVSGSEGNSGEEVSEVSKKHSGREEAVGNDHFKKHESDGTMERDENRGSGEIQQQNSTARLEPIIFDINEYRKPFNLDEFLKDDPIMKKLELLGKETRAMYRKSRKQVPSFFNEPESDNTSTEKAEEREDFAGDRDGFDFLPKSRRSSDFVDIFAKVDGKNMVKEKTGKNGNKRMRDGGSFNNDSNEDYLNLMIRKDKTESSSLEFKNEEDFRTRHFADDVIGSQQEDASVKGHRRRKDPRGKGGIRSALFPILNKKSRVSRLNEQVDKRINARNNSALVYKNFWPPGYNSLNKKADMEAQEKRK
ncbi:uncharacterized protein LOC143371182 [Andrena cerasifolii]|uniref:uncharacterized protein LOC143371182 n=1 Tax=Andrena cerasifolii TaxID=2819439 RepID=UPI0040380722